MLQKLQDQIDRNAAERDGWRMIATKLMGVALGADASQFSLPPLELFSDGWSVPDDVKHAVSQWWRQMLIQAEECRYCGAVDGHRYAPLTE